MRKRGRLALPLALILLILPFSAAAQNLLTNPGFDRDLSGWDYETKFWPGQYPGLIDASVVWSATDVLGRSGSGSAWFRQSVGARSEAGATLSQCLTVQPRQLYAVGGRFLIETQTADSIFVALDFFPDAGCEGTRSNARGGFVLASACFRTDDSGGQWLQAVFPNFSPADARSARLSLRVYTFTGSYCTNTVVDGLADDLFFEAVELASIPWLLPTSARVPGVNGSFWTTDLVLSNRNATGALATVKLLGHDVDGRNAEQRTLYVPGFQTRTVKDVLGSLFLRTVDYGALLVVASPGLAVVAENTTPVGGSSGSGTVGESLPAFGPTDLVGSAPKSLFPIRENDAFRTNLVLANASEFPITVHLRLFSPDGSLLGEDDVPLPSFGMKQVNRVAWSLGASGLDGGRLEVATATPDGLFAAYASLIDNATNDPRALLPR